MLMRKNAILKHHGPSPSIQQRFFFAHTKALVIAFQEGGVTKSSLSTPENMPDNVARSIMGALGEGNKQHADFVAHRLPSTAFAFYARR